MMKNFFVFAGILVLFSCGDRQIEQSTMDQVEEAAQIYDLFAFIENRDSEIETYGERVQSLVFTNDDNERKAILYYLNDTLSVIRETIREIKTNKQSEISYYFDASGLVLVQDITDHLKTDSSFSTIEKIQSYDKNGLKEAWKSSYENGAKDETAFSKFKGDEYNYEEALQMYSRTGAFQLHFEDFLHSEGDMFLLVNTGTPYNYIAAIKISMMDDFLIVLQKEKQKYKNKPIVVNSELVDQNGWLFHYYRGGSLTN